MTGHRWTEERVRRELEAFLPGHDVWPPYTAFRQFGRRGLWQAMTRRGGPQRFADEYGLPILHDRRGLDDAAVREQLRAALRGTDLRAWPSREWLIVRAGVGLAAAVERTGGASRWADEFGVPRPHLARQRWTSQTIAAALEPLLAGRTTWPNRREFETAGLAGMYATITHTEGHAAMARRHGLPLQRPRRRRTAARRPRPTAPSLPATRDVGRGRLQGRHTPATSAEL